MTLKPICLAIFLLLFLPLTIRQQAAAQTGALRGEVVDPSGAVVPDASIALAGGGHVFRLKSGTDGRYAFLALVPGSYTLAVTQTGFAVLTISNVTVTAGQTKELNLPLTIAVEHQQVMVTGQTQGVSINPDQNSSAMVLKGSDLDALSDDPDEMQSELQALAGPAAGPNGGQIYIDGFSGGQLPPKSSILEVRVNQNPFSAEFDRIGYGRVEIITKPGTQKLHGSISSYGNTSALNTANPLVSQKPSYDLYALFGNVSGPLTGDSAYFLNGFFMERQTENIVDALNPQNTAENLTEAVPDPSSVFVVSERIDFQAGKRNTLTVRDNFNRSAQTGNGVGTLNLPEQANNTNVKENSLQIGDTIVVNPRLLNEVHFQWRRIRSDQSPSYLTPTVTVQGAFTNGGNSSGVIEDHQDLFELQDYSTATAGNHTLRFGTRLRTYRDANYSTSGSNGTYIFSSVAAYQASQPSQYAATVISNPLARVLLFDGSLFLQDDWRWKPNLMIGLGLRYEGQNWIHDHADWAPRLALAWSPGRPGKAPAKTVVRAGYGWFYDRFTVPGAFNSATGTPYVIQTIHDNRVNQQSYVIANPAFYNPSAAETPAAIVSLNSSIPSYHTIDSHFHAALDMQAGMGVDRQLSKKITANVTYLYTQGVHQYLSNNVTAPSFDASTYTVTGATPAVYNDQFQSGGVYKQNQLIVTISAQLNRLVLNGSYTLNEAKSDTQGVTSFVSVAQNPGFDYGRASFGMRHRFTFLNSYMAPHGIVVASLLEVQSGTPFNVTIGEDLTANNQFNARPGYGTCGAPGVISTPYGCLDPSPAGKQEKIVPFGIGTGPANALFDLRVSKVFGVGPRTKTAGEGNTFQGGNDVSGRGLSSGGAAIHLDAAVPRRYNLTFVAGASNLLNIVNRGTPNGVLISPLFNKSQSLAGGAFENPSPGNRAIIFQSNFSF
jgi:hypothetical protein